VRVDEQLPWQRRKGDVVKWKLPRICWQSRHLAGISSLLTVDFLTERYMTVLQNHFINLKFKNRLIIIPDLLGKMTHKIPRKTFAKRAK
jgi:hypothetical protein